MSFLVGACRSDRFSVTVSRTTNQGTSTPVVSSGSGFVYAVAASVADGVISGQVYQDAGSNVLQEFISSGDTVSLAVRSSFPLVRVGDGSPVALPLVGGIYEGDISVTLSAGSQSLTLTAVGPDGADAATDTVQAVFTAPASLLTLAFSGGYPVGQTELKAGDSMILSGTTDLPVDGVQILDSGAGGGEFLTFASTTSFAVVVTIPDRGDAAQTLPVVAQVRDATSGALSAQLSTDEGGAGVDGVNTVILNNLAPSGSFDSIDYPVGQGALKNAEVATVDFSVSDADSVVFSSPTSELSITNPTLLESQKTVARISGDLNESTTNIQATLTRTANAATAVVEGVVVIQNIAPTIDLSLPQSRLRSGGNDGTSVQSYVLTLSSSQQLTSAPSLAVDSGGNRGAFSGAFSGGPSTWTRSLVVDETIPDEKGVFAFEGLVATNLSGLSTNTLNSGQAYELGGFVARDLTFSAFASSVQLGTSVEDFSKLSAGIFSATNQAALKQAIGTGPSVANGYTIDAVGANPTTLTWLDSAAISTNSAGTAQITSVEEVV